MTSRKPITEPAVPPDTDFANLITSKHDQAISERQRLEGQRTKKRWTTEETEIVSRMWLNEWSVEKIAAEMGGSRSVEAIKLHMNKIGANRQRCRTDFCKKVGVSAVRFVPGYSNWVSMNRRCRKPGPQNIEGYKDRNITVCDRWISSFEAFYEDMGPRPGPRFSIERVDNDKGYSPENCIWADPIIQQNNTRRNRYIEFRGKLMSVTMAYRLSGVSLNYEAFRQRIRNGWDIEKALFTPHRFAK